MGYCLFLRLILLLMLCFLSYGLLRHPRVSRARAVRMPYVRSATGGSAEEPLSSMNFYSVGKEELKATLKSMKQPAFRAGQIREWVYDRGVINFEDMLNLPKGLREQLSTLYHFGSLRLESELVSKDGTRKRAYALNDKQLIESVLMPYDDGRFTACISSQAGCAMGCVFCATGQMGFFRQLTATEIFEQAQKFSVELKAQDRRLSNVVLMGMGEPMANYKNVMAAIRRINTELGIGARHITISTVGLTPRIRKLADEDLQVGLAVSLHQSDDQARSALMPVNARYPINELLDACRYYVAKTNRRITFEWALIRGDTDSPETAHRLGMLLKGLLCHVNVIPLNPTGGFDGKPTSKAGVDTFCKILEDYGISATPRTRRGIDIDAGCGQLKADLLKKAEKERENLVSSDPAAEVTVGSLDVQQERERVFAEAETEE